VGPDVATPAGSSSREVEIRTLFDGGQTASEVAGILARFLDEANRTLDIALYDLKLEPPTEATVLGAIRRATERGVAVRLVYNEDDRNPIPVPPPPRTDPAQLAAAGVPVRAVPGVPDLMHHKYVVRDGDAVWTGSTNWTDDSWTREENVMASVRSPALATAFARNFEELWSSVRVAGTGEFDPDVVSMSGRGSLDGDDVAVDGGTIRAWFCPGRGRRLSHRIADAISEARERVRVCSPVITSGPVLGTLAELAAEGVVELAGVCDATQMQEVLLQWQADGHSPWKIPTFLALAAQAPFSGKPSTPYAPGAVHDYMHAKIVVADDVAFLGSYNLSHSGEENAENVLEIHHRRLADGLAAFADRVRGRYPPLRLVDPRVRPGARDRPGVGPPSVG
jgi:phosphatidylserine/phosphatidylglycerophosphate/cardiolipin synthase-like enzyme